MATEDNEAFNILEVFQDAPLGEESTESQGKEKNKKEKKKSKQDLEEERRINREKRKLKKEQREKNKKRKRGELVDDEDEEPTKEKSRSKKAKKSSKKDDVPKENRQHGIWVGNLAYRVSIDEIKAYFAQCGDIVGMKCPRGNGKVSNNRGYAYVFFSSKESVEKAIGLSETEWFGRKLLIKDASDYERKDGIPYTPPAKDYGKKSKADAGAASKEEKSKQKNAPSPTLFLGNLSFQATKELIKSHFESFGEIRRVRLATFEDSGKCKGFGYVDFISLESAVKAIRAPDRHTLNGRKIRVEFASEEAYNRGHPWLKRMKESNGADGKANDENSESMKQSDEQEEHDAHETPAPPKKQEHREKHGHKEKRKSKDDKSGRVKPGLALHNAPRQKASVQEFKGTKIVFD